MYGIPEFRSVSPIYFHTVLLFFLSGGKLIHMIHKLCVVGQEPSSFIPSATQLIHRIGCFRCFLCDLVGIGPRAAGPLPESRQNLQTAMSRRSTDTLCHKEDHSACDQRYDHCDLPCLPVLPYRPQAAPTGSAGASPGCSANFRKASPGFPIPKLMESV